MINVAPDEMVEMYRIARQLGDGDMKKGIESLIAIANKELNTCL